MRVSFDGRALTSPAGGVRRYTYELFTAIHRVAPSVDLTAVGPEGDAAVPEGVRRQPAAGFIPTNLGWSAVALPLAARRTPFDVFHAPAYTAPLWGVRPLVVTVHDVSYERHPEWYPYRTDPLRRAFYRASARRADRILTDSAFSKTEIVAAYAIDPGTIDVVPLGVSGIFTADPQIEREPFVLHVGDLHERRNLAMLVDVIADLRRTDPRFAALRLVLAGADRGSLAALRARAADVVEYVGQPDDDGLRDWYRRAAVMAYPSRYEGFGIPVLEAMACGAPVVAARAGAVPEIADDAALLLSPDDPGAWREALRALLTDAALAADRSHRGVKRAAEYTWSRTAEGTLAAYERTIEAANRRTRGSF